MDSHETYEAVCKRLGTIEAMALIVFVDFTRSNTWQGTLTQPGQPNLHTFPANGAMNQYEQALHAIVCMLKHLDDDMLIPTYGFGDAITKHNAVFDVAERLRMPGPPRGEEGVRQAYRCLAPGVMMSGNTSFAPAVLKAIETARQTRQYTVAIIVCDGCVSPECMADTKQAIRLAANYGISLVVVGVGDGDQQRPGDPWHQMKALDDGMDCRDILQFVDFAREFQGPTERDCLEAVGLAALQEVPEQYEAARSLLTRVSRPDPEFVCMYTRLYGRPPGA